jgi:hypothetical protein
VEAAGKIFGVSRVIVTKWERGSEAGGAPIPVDVQPSVLRWVETGEVPSEDELKRLSERRQRAKWQSV